MDLEVARAQRHCLRDSFRDDAGLQPAKMRKADASTIMRMKSLGFDDVGTRYTESGVSRRSGELGGLRILLHARGSGKEKDSAVGQNAVHVKENELDLFGPGFGHGGIVNELTVQFAWAKILRNSASALESNSHVPHS